MVNTIKPRYRENDAALKHLKTFIVKGLDYEPFITGLRSFLKPGVELIVELGPVGNRCLLI